MTETHFVKIYGLQRSGTNWLKFLLEQNFADTIVVDLPLGNKHELPRPDDALREWRTADEHAVDPSTLPYGIDELDEALHAGRVRAAAIVKPLLPWLVSFSRYRRLKEPELYGEITPKMAAQWTRRWVEVNSGFLANLPSYSWRQTVVDYAELLRDLQQTLENLQNDLALRRSPAAHERWIATDRTMKRSTDVMHGNAVVSDRPFDATHYEERRYLDELPREVLDVVRRELSSAPSVELVAGSVDPDGVLGFISRRAGAG